MQKKFSFWPTTLIYITCCVESNAKQILAPPPPPPAPLVYFAQDKFCQLKFATCSSNRVSTNMRNFDLSHVCSKINSSIFGKDFGTYMRIKRGPMCMQHHPVPLLREVKLDVSLKIKLSSHPCRHRNLVNVPTILWAR